MKGRIFFQQKGRSADKEFKLIVCCLTQFSTLFQSYSYFNTKGSKILSNNVWEITTEQLFLGLDKRVESYLQRFVVEVCICGKLSFSH